MPSSRRYARLGRVQLAACVGAMLGGGALAGLGILGYGASTNTWLIAFGGLLVFLAVVFMTTTPVVLKLEATVHRQLSESRDANEAFARLHAGLEMIAENTRISDAAKSLARRAEELDALREAIRHDIRNQSFSAAASLAKEIGERLGYREEAESLGAEIDEARREWLNARVGAAIEHIEQHFHARDWVRAREEIDRLNRIARDDGRVDALRERMSALQEEHKTILQQEWEVAVRRNDTDHAIEVLRELDPYLTPPEVEAIQSTARTVFKEKLLQLGVQFRFAVQGKRWQDAVDIGLELIREFPNARMAHEVRERIETLRERARAAATGQSADAT